MARPANLTVKGLNKRYTQGTGKLPGDGKVLDGWGKQSGLALTFFPEALEVNWGFSISLTLQGVIPSIQLHLCEQPHPGSLILAQMSSYKAAVQDRKAMLY